MASAGSPPDDEEIIDYMLTGLGKAFNPIAASLSVVITPVTLAKFYAMVLNYEALQLSQQADDEEWTSSANAAARSGAPATVNRSRAPDSGCSTDTRSAGGYPQQQGQGYPQGGYQQQGGQDNRRNNGGGGGGNGRNGNRRWRPKCQICKFWGHEADTCKKRFEQDSSSGNGRSAYNASASNNSTHWIMDSGTTDHLTSDLERLHVRERYGGHDQVQVANGPRCVFFLAIVLCIRGTSVLIDLQGASTSHVMSYLTSRFFLLLLPGSRSMCQHLKRLFLFHLPNRL